MNDRDIQKFSRIDYDDDTTLVLSERLLNSLFDHIKDGLYRTEQLVQDMSKVIIVVSEKQDGIDRLINSFHKEIENQNGKVIQIMDTNTEFIKLKADENIREHANTKISLKDILDITGDLKDKFNRYFITMSIVNVIIGLITAILSWFVFFKG